MVFVFSPILVIPNRYDMKVLNSPFISPFGGLNFVICELDKLGVGKMLNSELPSICPRSLYDWRDILYSYWSVFLCGGDCAEDLGGNFGASLGTNPLFSKPSPDRVLERCKQLAEEPTLYVSKRGRAEHYFALNDTLNGLNLALCRKLFGNALEEVTVDYDNTLCHNQKRDATRTYKFEDGYQPGVALIGSMVAYVENRSGKSTAHVGQAETLSRMFALFQEHGISVKRFRADSASYTMDIINTIEENSGRFYVRARMNETLERAISGIAHWERVPNGQAEVHRGETTFKPFARVVRGTKKANDLRTYRLVVTKEERKDGQVNAFTGEAYLYSAIVTNDRDMTAGEVVQFYNQRGKAEREFDVLKNDFGWGRLPFSFLGQNNVYLLVTAMCRNIYHYMIQLFSKKVKGLRPTYRLKKFIFRFICIPAKWVRHAGQWQLRLYGEVAFKT